jgi:hypothetical protein
MKYEITKADILSLEEFSKIRQQKRTAIGGIKRNRRVPLGPEATLYFENYDTLWWQIQEMLYIEKGGDAQLEDELLAYNPLLPQGKELVATFMIEIESPERRSKILAELGGVEQYLSMRFGGHVLKAIPEEDPYRTTDAGKTSAIHFLRWHLSPDQIKDFSKTGQDIVVEISHPKFTHKAIMSEPVRQALSQDFI